MAGGRAAGVARCASGAAVTNDVNTAAAIACRIFGFTRWIILFE